jgi:hypothetical protein
LFITHTQVDVSADSTEALPLIIMERSHDPFLTPGTVQFVKGHDVRQRVITMYGSAMQSDTVLLVVEVTPLTDITVET